MGSNSIKDISTENNYYDSDIISDIPNILSNNSNDPHDFNKTSNSSLESTTSFQTIPDVQSQIDLIDNHHSSILIDKHNNNNNVTTPVTSNKYSDSIQSSDIEEDNTNFQKMIHTKILEKDNPFLSKIIKDDQKINNSNLNLHSNVVTIKEKNQNKNDILQTFTMATEKIYNIKNPNGEYLDTRKQENDNNSNSNSNNNNNNVVEYFDITKTNDRLLSLQMSPHNKLNQNNLTHSNNNNSNNDDQNNPEFIYNNTNKNKIIISEATNVSEGQSRSYIAYTIIYGLNSVKRRYSDFESLRNLLIRLFPITFIPPIPEKQNLKVFSKTLTNSSTNYLLPTDIGRSLELSLSKLSNSSKNSDEKFIRRRIKMLTIFLNLLFKNDEIMDTSILFEFLNPNVPNWNDFITNSPTFSNLPKNILQCNPLDPTNTTRIHASLPIPTSSLTSSLSIQHSKVDNNTNNNNNNDDDHDDNKNKVSNSDNDLQNDLKTTESSSKQPETTIVESFDIIGNNYKLYETLCKNTYKYNKRIMKNIGELKIDYRDIGQEFLNFSNKELQQLDLAEIFLYFSSTFDKSYNICDQLVTKFDNVIIDQLNEIVYMASSVKELIKFQRLKYIQKEMIKKALQSKQNQLNKLQIEKNNFKSIDKIIDQEMGKSHQISFERPQKSQNDNNTSYTGKFFKRINKLANIVKESIIYQDTDPDILMDTLGKEIDELKEIYSVIDNDLIFISKEIKEKQLVIFSQIRKEEWSLAMKNCAKAFKDYATRSLKVWKELKLNYEREEASQK